MLPPQQAMQPLPRVMPLPLLATPLLPLPVTPLLPRAMPLPPQWMPPPTRPRSLFLPHRSKFRLATREVLDRPGSARRRVFRLRRR